jgi:hypothetical protein
MCSTKSFDKTKNSSPGPMISWRNRYEQMLQFLIMLYMCTSAINFIKSNDDMWRKRIGKYYNLWKSIDYGINKSRRSDKTFKSFSVHTSREILSNEGTFSTVKSLLSSDSVHKVGPSEVWKTPKGRMPLDLSAIVITILLKFQSLAWNIPINRTTVFWSDLFLIDRSISE